METTNGGPSIMKEDEQFPLKKYRTTLYTRSDDDTPEKLPLAESKYKTALYTTNAENGDLDELTGDSTFGGGGSTDQKRKDGLNMHQAVLQIAGFCPGFAATIVMLAIIHSGWIGFILFAVLIFLLAYSAVLLGNCWNLIHDVTRFNDVNPYGAIAYEAFGGWARSLTNILVDLVSFGGTAAMLLAISELVIIIIGPTLYGSYCYWPLIVGAVMCPVIWVGIPRNVWQLGALSIVTTLLAFLIIFIDAVVNLEGNGRSLDNLMPELNLWAYGKLLAGTIFLLGGHFVYPEIQMAMKESKKFDRSVLTSLLLLAVFLFPILLSVFVSYGGNIDIPLEQGSLLGVINRDGMVIISGLLLIINSAPVMFIFINPLFQHLEDVFNIPAEIGWKRIFTRSVVILLLVFLAETVPDFAVLMTVVGGILLPFLTFLAPNLCYLRLRSMYMSNSWQERPKMHLFETITSVLVLIAATAIILAVFIILVIALVSNEAGIIKPCYVQFNKTDALNVTDYDDDYY